MIDGTRGVQAQTLTVWKQLDKFGVSRIVFLNKLDRERRNVSLCLESIRDKLKTVPVLVNYPVIGESGELLGVTVTPPSPDHLTDTVESLCELDPEIEALYLDNNCDPQAIPGPLLSHSITRLSREGHVTPVCVGSGLSGVGVRECIEYIIKYLPSPSDILPASLPPQLQGGVCGVIFKSSLDPHGGVLCQSRLYSGVLKPRTKLLNLRTGTISQISNLFSVDADMVNVKDRADSGEIVMFTGPKDLRTGDIYVSHNWASNSESLQQVIAQGKYRSLTSSISLGKPLFFCNVEAKNDTVSDKLEQVLEQMTFEDPTLTLTKTQNGELVLGGNGQLHLSVVKDRLRDEHGIQCKAYKIRVSYMETVTEQLSDTFLVPDLGDVLLSLAPGEAETPEVRITGCSTRIKEVIYSTIYSALAIGPLLGLPLTRCKVTARISDMAATDLHLSKPLARRITAHLKKHIKDMLVTGKPQLALAQPIAEFEIEGPGEFSSRVISDFHNRAGGDEYTLTFSNSQEWFNLAGTAPLSKLSDLASSIRHLSHGSASVLNVEMLGYQTMDHNESNEIINLFKSGKL